MSEKIVQLNEEVIKGQHKELVRSSVEETLNELLEAEAEKLTQAGRYERNEQRQGYRSGHYSRNFTTISSSYLIVQILKLGKNGTLTKRQCALHIVMQLLFCVDVIDSVYLFFKNRKCMLND